MEDDIEELSIIEAETLKYHKNLIILTVSSNRVIEQPLGLLVNYDWSKPLYITVRRSKHNPEMLITYTAACMVYRQREIIIFINNKDATLKDSDTGAPIFQEHGLVGILLGKDPCKKIIRALLLYADLHADYRKANPLSYIVERNFHSD